MEKLGVENIKKVVKLGIDLAEQVQTAAADGWQPMDALGFIDELAQIPGVIKNAGEVPAEVADLDDAEKNEVIAYVAQEWDLPETVAWERAKKAITLVLTLTALVNDLRN